MKHRNLRIRLPKVTTTNIICIGHWISRDDLFLDFPSYVQAFHLAKDIFLTSPHKLAIRLY